MNTKTNFTNWKRKISCYKYSFLEFLAVKINFFNKLLIKWRTPVFLKEIEMANVTSKDKVLHLGCGFFPTASLIVAEKTKAKVIGIDNNKIALNFAKKVVEKKNLSDFIKIEFGDGTNYDMKQFNVIFIAINVWPIDDVLQHLSAHCNKDARIVCRGLKDMLDIFEKKPLSDLYYVEKKATNPKTHSFLLSLKH